MANSENSTERQHVPVVCEIQWDPAANHPLTDDEVEDKYKGIMASLEENLRTTGGGAPISAIQGLYNGYGWYKSSGLAASRAFMMEICTMLIDLCFDLKEKRDNSKLYTPFYIDAVTFKQDDNDEGTLKAYITLIADAVPAEDPKVVWRKDMVSLIHLAKYLLCDDYERFLEKNPAESYFRRLAGSLYYENPQKFFEAINDIREHRNTSYSGPKYEWNVINTGSGTKESFQCETAKTLVSVGGGIHTTPDTPGCCCDCMIV
ncbi:MAG: hypothetical protein J3Q66DRAFT_406100 [Benniella sp.]|nr:MAG: hypothetical protein J3Q66DRAFT_406100 [Benniella sp.]